MAYSGDTTTTLLAESKHTTNMVVRLDSHGRFERQLYNDNRYYTKDNFLIVHKGYNFYTDDEDNDDIDDTPISVASETEEETLKLNWICLGAQKAYYKQMYERTIVGPEPNVSWRNRIFTKKNLMKTTIAVGLGAAAYTQRKSIKKKVVGIWDVLTDKEWYVSDQAFDIDVCISRSQSMVEKDENKNIILKQLELARNKLRNLWKISDRVRD
jgi:hypothetical protein